MNPWGLLVLGVGILVIVVALKGSASQVASAFKSQPAQPGLAASAPAPLKAPAQLPSFLAPPPQYP